MVSNATLGEREIGRRDVVSKSCFFFIHEAEESQVWKILILTRWQYPQLPLKPKIQISLQSSSRDGNISTYFWFLSVAHQVLAYGSWDEIGVCGDWSIFGRIFRFGFLVGYHNFFFSPYGSRILGGCQWWVMCVVVSRPCILSISLSHANTTQTHNINTLSFTSTHFFYNSPPPSLSLSQKLRVQWRR